MYTYIYIWTKGGGPGKCIYIQADSVQKERREKRVPSTNVAEKKREIGRIRTRRNIKKRKRSMATVLGGRPGLCWSTRMSPVKRGSCAGRKRARKESAGCM